MFVIYVILLLCHNSQAEPGEGVGIVASQSIGEPSTQMVIFYAILFYFYSSKHVLLFLFYINQIIGLFTNNSTNKFLRR